MPNAAGHPCVELGCPAVVPRGQSRCADHRRQYEQRRGSSTSRGYDGRWATYSVRFRAAHPRCGDKVPYAYPSTASQCARNGRVTRSQVVHHIRGHRGGRDPLFWDERNHEALCKRCHDSVLDPGERGHVGTVP